MKKSAPFPKGSVCKPCWELKYCPYGAAVDYFPHATPGGSTTYLQGNERHSELLEEIRQLTSITPESIHDYSRLLSLTDPGNRAYVARYYEAVACEATGHACPVFFLQSGATETREPRRESRHIPRAVMLQVVRRDNHVCQLCLTYVRDENIEFDHIIPFSRGGPTTAANLRLLCKSCNRKRSNSTSDAIDGAT
jgi:HNH endonuclease